MRELVNDKTRRLVIDSGGLSALCEGTQSSRIWLEALRAFKGRIELPVVTLAESTCGDSGRDARTNRFLAMLRSLGHVPIVCDELLARRAGKLRHAARSDDGIDAIVAAIAAGDGSRAMLLTSDPHDLSMLLARNANVKIVRV